MLVGMHNILATTIATAVGATRGAPFIKVKGLLHSHIHFAIVQFTLHKFDALKPGFLLVILKLSLVPVLGLLVKTVPKSE